MKIILSPAKKMREEPDLLPCGGVPVFLPEAETLLQRLQSMTDAELQKLWGCNDAIAAQNTERLARMDLHKNLTPAVISYDGIAFQHMAPSVFEEEHFRYLEEHLRILSGLYGVLKPMDGVRPYRLEMQAKLRVGEARDLYAFWGRKLYDAVRDDDGLIINLASKEYYKCIEKYLAPSDRFITCTFCEKAGGKLVTRATFAKMARGEMVRYLAENAVTDPAEMKGFDRLGFSFRPDLSSDAEYVFERMTEQNQPKNAFEF